MALHIAAALEAELTQEEQRRIRKEPTDDVEAYQLYLLARHCIIRWTQEGVEQGLKHLEQAVTRDPNYALAYATMGYIYGGNCTSTRLFGVAPPLCGATGRTRRSSGRRQSVKASYPRGRTMAHVARDCHGPPSTMHFMRNV